ncbi:MAG: hypothetical protein Kow0099_06610 [Candidatus Abyssubacteria bacterium]
MKVLLSVGVQKMVRPDKAGSGVMFSIDTETGFPDVVVINAAWRLGENVVQGAVTPDEYRVFKPPLNDNSFRPIIEKTLGDKEKKMVYAGGGSTTTKNVDTPKEERGRFVLEDDEILQLARWACAIEDHYCKPMDMEWAKDGDTEELFIVKIHPLALVRFDDVKDEEARKEIERLTRGYKDKSEYFVQHLAQGIARIAASQYPAPVIVRMSDFKTNEYANLIGGTQFEPDEENPMLGFRGASRYYSKHYRDGFALECRAIKRVRDTIGLTNVIIMIPFCRRLDEADRVLDVLAEHELRRGDDGLQVYVMCEVPSNVILADQFAKRFDGFSIGSNDLTQLVLGVDRDSEELKELFDERNEAVTREIRRLIKVAHEARTKVGICGQAPSDYPEFAAFLVSCGIDSISLNPDSVLDVKRRVAEEEQKRGKSG